MSDEQDKTPDEIMRELAEKQQHAHSPVAPERELTTAEKESLLKKRKEQELKEKNKDNEQEVHQPEVTKIKKGKKDKLLKWLIGFILLAVVFGLVGMNVWRTYTGQGKKEQTTDNAVSTGGKTANVRNDLGQDNPFPGESGDGDTEGNSDGQVADTGGKKAPPPPKPAVFSRALASVSTATASGSTTRSRSEEKGKETEAGSDSTSVKTDGQGVPAGTTPQSLKAVTRIPYDPDLYIPENRAIPCALTRRFVSDVAGKLQCVLTEDIYSASGNTRLLDKGTLASLEYKSGTLAHGVGRAFIIVRKLRTAQPPYLDIPMDVGGDSSAAGELGEAGVSGWIDNHYVQRFSGALMVGMVPDVMGALSNQAGKKDRNTDYTENSREAFADMAKETLKNSINIPPTLYKNQGEIITLIANQDIDFSHIYQLKLKR